MKLKNENFLKSNFMFISSKRFKTLKSYLLGKMIKNIVNIIYYIFIFVGCWIFFSDFILLKLPFGLTQKFRGMMQQGLNLPNFDVSYVCVISWYLILVFGLNNNIQFFDGREDFSIYATTRTNDETTFEFYV